MNDRPQLLVGLISGSPEPAADSDAALIHPAASEGEARKKARQLCEQFPGTRWGVYRLASIFEPPQEVQST